MVERWKKFESLCLVKITGFTRLHIWSARTRRREIALNALGNYPWWILFLVAVRVLEFCETLWKLTRVGNGASNGKSMILPTQHCGGSGIERRRRAKPVIAVKDSSLLHSLSPPTFNLATASSVMTTTTTKTTRTTRTTRTTSVHYAHILFSSFLFFFTPSPPSYSDSKKSNGFTDGLSFWSRENKRRESSKNAVTNAR